MAQVLEVYWQGLRDAAVDRVQVPRLGERAPPGCEGYVQYVKLFSAEYHSKPVVVRPEEAGLVSVRPYMIHGTGYLLGVSHRQALGSTGASPLSRR